MPAVPPATWDEYYPQEPFGQVFGPLAWSIYGLGSDRGSPMLRKDAISQADEAALQHAFDVADLLSGLSRQESYSLFLPLERRRLGIRSAG
jgi:hypothetical protein